MINDDVRYAVERSLFEARQVIQGLKDGGNIIGDDTGGFGDETHDIELVADEAIGKRLQAIQREHQAGRISVEGLGDLFVASPSGYYWFCNDPLDASMSYRLRGNTIGLPYSTAVTVFSRTRDVRFRDIIAAGVIDLRSSDRWLAVRRDDGALETDINGIRARTADVSKLDLGKMVVIVEMYYKEDRERFARAFRDDRGWITNPHSAAYEQALVSSGQAVAYICGRQKCDVLGAGYALVKGAGGVVVDFNGRDIGDQPYEFKNQVPVILAANQAIADQILLRLHRAD